MHFPRKSFLKIQWFNFFSHWAISLPIPHQKNILFNCELPKADFCLPFIHQIIYLT